MVGPAVQASEDRVSVQDEGQSGEGWGLVETESGGFVFYRMSLSPHFQKATGAGLLLPAGSRVMGRGGHGEAVDFS